MLNGLIESKTMVAKPSFINSLCILNYFKKDSIVVTSKPGAAPLICWSDWFEQVLTTRIWNDNNDLFNQPTNHIIPFYPDTYNSFRSTLKPFSFDDFTVKPNVSAAIYTFACKYMNYFQ